MNDAQRYKLIFNGAGAVVTLIVGGYFVNNMFAAANVPTCAATYGVAMPLSVEGLNGGLMSAIELEARIGGREISVAEFAKVVPGDRRDMPAVLEVSLPKGSIRPQARSTTAGGIGFDWQPGGITGAKAACLSYNVFLPEDFDFKRGGTLPGIHGTATADSKGKPSFTTRVMWRDRGEGEITAMLPNGSDKRATSLDRGSFKLTTGTWTRIDQEIVLNTPDKKDGQLRLWVDGELKFNRRGIAFRTQPDVSIAGAAVDVHYGGTDASFAAPKDTTIRLSPPVLRIN